MVCGKTSESVSSTLAVCRNCILNEPGAALAETAARRKKLRKKFELPNELPRNKSGGEGVKHCKGCVNKCEISESSYGFCGLRANRNGKLEVLAGTPRGAIVEWYYDSLPTNCVADFVCAGGCGTGYPKYSHADGKPEYGFSNLAVFYRACTFDCSFCQNWHFRNAHAEQDEKFDARSIAEAALDRNTSCICYFGGDPTPQITHSLKAGRLARELKGEDGIMRVCWETNGSMPWALARPVGELALESGGCIKFDLKVMNENLHQALCGTSNKNTRENFSKLWDRYGSERTEPPLLVASTLLVPSYIDVEEVREVAEFLAELDRSIPYSLLAFHPDFNMMDMGVTTRKAARNCLRAAEEAGLSRVRLGNQHLLI
jgi:pyruvate formate lyase activating enzyme